MSRMDSKLSMGEIANANLAVSTKGKLGEKNRNKTPVAQRSAGTEELKASAF